MTILRELKYYFTEEERAELGERVARLVEERENLDAEKKLAAKKYGQEIAEIDGEIGSVARLIRKKYEIRSVECDVINDYKAKTVVVMRIDTGEPVESRPMTPDELQGRLFDGPGQDVEQFPDGGFVVKTDIPNVNDDEERS